ncbi:MAG: class I SAM-dependent methyltransferase [archaeon]
MTYYDDISEGYEELYKEEQLKKIEILKKYLKPSKTDRLLDVGCGTGVTTIPWNCTRYGIDPAKKLIERAHQKEKVDYKIAAAESIPYPDGFFDIVISVTAIQNFADIEKGLDEIKRVGKDKFVLTFLKKSSSYKRIKKLIYNKFQIKKEIEETFDLILIS